MNGQLGNLSVAGSTAGMEEQGTEADKDCRFFISVAGKKGLRRLRWRKACSTKPDPLAKCEFYMSIAGILYDGCKHFSSKKPLEGDGAAQASEAEDESSSRILYQLRFSREFQQPSFARCWGPAPEVF